MACSWRIYLSAYLDGELSADKREEVEEHLRFCKECSEEFRLLKRLNRAVERMLNVSDDVSAEEWERCFKDAWRRRVGVAFRRRLVLLGRWFGVVGAAAVVLILIALLSLPAGSSVPNLVILDYGDKYMPLQVMTEGATVIRLVETQEEGPSLEVLDYGGGYMPLQVMSKNATIIRLVEEGDKEGGR